MNRLANKVAVVTGAASGIGAAISNRLAREGARVAVIDINEKGIEDQLKHMSDNGWNARGYNLDLINVGLFDTTLEQINSDFGQIDILVNNAGIAVTGNLGSIESESYDKLMAINVKAPLFFLQSALPYLRKTRGNVVNTSSASAHGTHSLLLTAYAMSKAGVSKMTELAAADGVKNTGVRVNAIAPGVVETPMTAPMFFEKGSERGALLNAVRNVAPVGSGIIYPDTIAAAVAFLASDEAANITGQVMTIDGGRSVYPDEAFMTRVKRPEWLKDDEDQH